MVNHNKFKKQSLKNAQLALPNNSNLSTNKKKRLDKGILSPKNKFKYFKSLDPVMAKTKLMAEFKNKCSYDLWNSFVNNYLSFARSDLNFSEAESYKILEKLQSYISESGLHLYFYEHQDLIASLKSDGWNLNLTSEVISKAIIKLSPAFAFLMDLNEDGDSYDVICKLSNAKLSLDSYVFLAAMALGDNTLAQLASNGKLIPDWIGEYAPLPWADTLFRLARLPLKSKKALLALMNEYDVIKNKSGFTTTNNLSDDIIKQAILKGFTFVKHSLNFNEWLVKFAKQSEDMENALDCYNNASYDCEYW